MNIKKFSSELIEFLNYYVYIYIDPETKDIFYVGKGKGNRVFSHLYDTSESEKALRIQEIRNRGQEPIIEILIHGLEDEEIALKVEAAVIDLIGTDKLTNKVRGHKSSLYGRISIEQLIQRSKNEVATIDEPSLLIRINKLFHYGMSRQELYDTTRAYWKIGEDREKVKYAFAIYDGIIQEVYTVLKWFKGGETMNTQGEDRAEDRWEFVGNIAPENIRKKYLNKSVKHYFKHGNQAPIVYVNIKTKNQIE